MTTETITIPPQDLIAERATLGGMMLNEAGIDAAAAILTGNQYYADVHGLIHDAIVGMRSKGLPVDPITLVDELDRRGQLVEVGGIAYITEMMEQVHHSGNTGHYAQIVRDMWVRRQVEKDGLCLAASARDQTKDPSELIAEVATVSTRLSTVLSGVEDRTPHAVIRSIADVQATRLDWLWPDRFPRGKISLIAGDPGLGKSFLTMDIAARTSLRSRWPDDSKTFHPAGSVMIFNAEDDVADTIRPRLESAGADLSKIFFVEGVVSIDRTGQKRSRGFSLQMDMPYLDKWAETTPDAALLIIDPISAYCGSVDSHKNAEVRSMLAVLAEWAARHSIAIILVTHLSKGAGGKAVYRAMGSLAFAAAARAVWSVNRDLDDEERRLLLPVKMNLSRESSGMAYRIENGVVCWEDSPVAMTADDYLSQEASQATESPTSKSAREEAVDWLRSTLENGSRPGKEVIADGKELGHTEKTLRRAFKDMGGKPQKVGFSKGWIWSLTEAVEDGQLAPEDAEDSLSQSEGILASSRASSEVDFDEVADLFGGRPA